MARKTTLANFDKVIGDWQVEFLDDVEKTMKKAAILADQTVVLATPVDTGRARSNWVPGIEKPTRDVVETGDQGEAENTNRTLEKTRRTILAASNPKKIFLSNNLPYIERLNNGYSKQAPANFVQKAVRTVLESLKNVKILKGA